MRRLEKDRGPALLLTGQAVQPQMTHPPAACSRFLRRDADARTPPDLDQARIQDVTERAALGLVLERVGGHKHSMTGMIKTTLEQQAESAARAMTPRHLMSTRTMTSETTDDYHIVAGEAYKPCLQSLRHDWRRRILAG